MKCNEFEGLYADGEPYKEYINRRLSESVQYRPKEESEMGKYFNYEVEEEKTEEHKDDKSLGLLGDMICAILAVLFFGGILGTLFWILGSLCGG